MWPSNDCDAELDFYNSDGGRSSACGNGTRCVAYLISKEKKSNKITLKTLSGILESKILQNKIVETNIGSAKVDWKQIPLRKKIDSSNLNIEIEDKHGNKFKGGYALSVGNPHLIFFAFQMTRFGAI